MDGTNRIQILSLLPVGLHGVKCLNLVSDGLRGQMVIVVRRSQGSDGFRWSQGSDSTHGLRCLSFLCQFRQQFLFHFTRIYLIETYYSASSSSSS